MQPSHIQAAKLEVLRYVKPTRYQSLHAHFAVFRSDKPEVQVIDRALLVAHEYVEGEQIQRRDRPTAQHFEEVRKAVAVELR